MDSSLGKRAENRKSVLYGYNLRVTCSKSFSRMYELYDIC